MKNREILRHHRQIPAKPTVKKRDSINVSPPVPNIIPFPIPKGRLTDFIRDLENGYFYRDKHRDPKPGIRAYSRNYDRIVLQTFLVNASEPKETTCWFRFCSGGVRRLIALTKPLKKIDQGIQKIRKANERLPMDDNTIKSAESKAMDKKYDRLLRQRNAVLADCRSFIGLIHTKQGTLSFFSSDIGSGREEKRAYFDFLYALWLSEGLQARDMSGGPRRGAGRKGAFSGSAKRQQLGKKYPIIRRAFYQAAKKLKREPLELSVIVRELTVAVPLDENKLEHKLTDFVDENFRGALKPSVFADREAQEWLRNELQKNKEAREKIRKATNTFRR